MVCLLDMSRKQAKEGEKGGDDNIKVVGNASAGFKKMWMKCGSDECDVLLPIKAPEEGSGENDGFRCDVCMVKEMMKNKMECMKCIDEERKESGGCEGR